MSLVSTSIANLVNGVSQQPYALRLGSQCELQENCDSSVVDGLRPRNGSRHLAKILATPTANAFTHLINRDSTERYRVVITSGKIEVYTMDGTWKGVSYDSTVQAYLTSSSPKDDFVALTVEDYTFIVNKSKVVDYDPFDTVPVRGPEALVWIKTSAPSVKYSISVNGFMASVTTSTDAASQATDTIAANLVVQLQAALGVSAALFSISSQGSSVHINRLDLGDFTIAVTDSMGDQAATLIKGKTQRFSNLPARAHPGMKTSVDGEGVDFGTTYWVEYVADAANQYGGTWRESAAPSQYRSLKSSTMPHALVREADGTFTLKRIDWVPRKVGDVASNPFPSFVGSKINDVFFHRNRLGFLSEENLILSKSGEYFDFFRSSVLQLLDTDPIDIGVSHTKVSILRHAVPFNESLLLFSDQTQFMLGRPSNDVLTAKTVSVDQTTEYECSLRVKPVGVGNYVYFAQTRDAWSSIREFSVDADTQTKDAQDVTSHVPKYIPSGVFKLAVANTQSIMVALSDKTPNSLWIYQYYLSNGTKLQSAWHEWKFPATDTILNVDFIESTLHLLVSRPDGTYMETLPVQPGYTEGNVGFSLHRDRIVTESQATSKSYDPVNRKSIFVIPYTPQEGEEYELIAWEGDPNFKLGTKIKFELIGSQVYASTGLHQLTKFRFGRKFKARYVFSQLQIREDAKGGGQVAIGEGRINVRRMSLTYGKSGYFRMEVSPQGREKYTYVMSGRAVGSSLSLLGDVSLLQGTFRIPVMARNTQVTVELCSDEFLPFAILSADWEGMFVIRSRRL